MHPLSTSNHNVIRFRPFSLQLYCILFLHQTTTSLSEMLFEDTLYCILFLHQTTTGTTAMFPGQRLYCILFLHQTTTRRLKPTPEAIVVLHPLSTSNHNDFIPNLFRHSVVLHPLSTSNHNNSELIPESELVVLHPLSTSNHNRFSHLTVAVRLYCILFLHQTTTSRASSCTSGSCIASSFYIKPQQ